MATLASTDVKTQIIEDEQRRISRSSSDMMAFFAKARNNERKGKKSSGNQADKPKFDKVQTLFSL